jgi:hypothetical protein
MTISYPDGRNAVRQTWPSVIKLAIIVLIENNNDFITKCGYTPSLSEVNAKCFAILFYSEICNN